MGATATRGCARWGAPATRVHVVGPRPCACTPGKLTATRGCVWRGGGGAPRGAPPGGGRAPGGGGGGGGGGAPMGAPGPCAGAARPHPRGVPHAPMPRPGAHAPAPQGPCASATRPAPAGRPPCTGAARVHAGGAQPLAGRRPRPWAPRPLAGARGGGAGHPCACGGAHARVRARRASPRALAGVCGGGGGRPWVHVAHAPARRDPTREGLTLTPCASAPPGGPMRQRHEAHAGGASPVHRCGTRA